MDVQDVVMDVQVAQGNMEDEGVVELYVEDLVDELVSRDNEDEGLSEIPDAYDVVPFLMHQNLDTYNHHRPKKDNTNHIQNNKDKRDSRENIAQIYLLQLYFQEEFVV